MNRSPLIEGRFKVCTVVSVPKTRERVLGTVTFTDQHGRTATASFLFEDGWRIVPEGDNPVFAPGRYGYVTPGSKLVAFVGTQGRIGNVLTYWGTMSQYEEARAEIDLRFAPKTKVTALVPRNNIDVRMARTLRLSPELQALHQKQLGAV